MASDKKETAASAIRRASAILSEHFPEAMLCVCWQTARKTTKVHTEYFSSGLCVLSSRFIGPHLDMIDVGNGVSVSHESEYDTSAEELISPDDEPDDDDA